MKMEVMIRFDGGEPQEAEISVPYSQFRRMVESVTKAEDGQPMPDLSGLTFTESGQVIDSKPPVDDSLTKAREYVNMNPICWNAALDCYESAIRKRDEKIAEQADRLAQLESGLAKNAELLLLQEKLSQSMTVEELKEWYDEWNYASGYSCSFVFFVTRKIAERNEKARKDGE